MVGPITLLYDLSNQDLRAHSINIYYCLSDACFGSVNREVKFEVVRWKISKVLSKKAVQKK